MRFFCVPTAHPPAPTPDPPLLRYHSIMYPIDLPARVILLPGLGANHKLFTPQKQVFRESLQTPDLIAPESPHESMRSYALRLAEHLRPGMEADAEDDRPLLIGGVSLGGMLALEMAQALAAQGVILIASCRRDSAIPLRSRIAEALGRSVPASLVPKLLTALSLPFAVLNELDDDGFALLKQMSAEIDPAVLKWGGGAIADWESDGNWPVPIHQVHGNKDRVLPPSGDADLLIPDGGHLINLTHAQTVNRFIVQAAEHYAGTPATPVL